MPGAVFLPEAGVSTTDGLSVRLDKVAQVFDLFGYELVPQKKVK